MKRSRKVGSLTGDPRLLRYFEHKQDTRASIPTASNLTYFIAAPAFSASSGVVLR
jgi:hypothetical protein